jgi:hypothetical protein
MVRALPVPDCSISGLMDGSSRKLGIVGLELLRSGPVSRGHSSKRGRRPFTPLSL